MAKVKSWTCYCGMKFLTVMDYVNHMQEHPLKCKCTQWFYTIGPYLSHTCYRLPQHDH